MLRPSFAYPAAWSIGTILERLVPCMSGSSKRTFRMPRSFPPASTRPTQKDLPSAITMASTPAPVVPKANVEPDLGREHLGRVHPYFRDDYQHASFAAVAALEGSGHRVRWLQVTALPAERWVRVVHHDQRAPRASNQHLELDEMPHVPVGFRLFDRASLQLGQQDLDRRPARPHATGAKVCEQLRTQARSLIDEPLDAVRIPVSAQGHTAKPATRCRLNRPGQCV